jgi:L-alanine-DL-glutamate epimerase-like enolase superfamily enzyme
MKNSRQIQINIERFPIKGRFIIARGAKTEAAVVTATVSEGEAHGRGECVPYARYGETVESVAALLGEMCASVESGLDRNELQRIMPAGAARNALDCALWDLEAKKTGVRAHTRAGLTELSPVITAYTISLDLPEAMAEAAAKAADRPLLKIKLGAPGGDHERIRAVRAAAPRSQLIADANEGWTEENLIKHLHACADAGFVMIEQPLSAKSDEFLRSLQSPVPLCADESVHDRASLERLKGLYDYVNIKLDKTGGLTEALALADAALSSGFGLMVGCMVGTSLAMAPALILAAKAKFVDLDGPLLLDRDRENGLTYAGSLVSPPPPELWG